MVTLGQFLNSLPVPYVIECYLTINSIPYYRELVINNKDKALAEFMIEIDTESFGYSEELEEEILRRPVALTYHYAVFSPAITATIRPFVLTVQNKAVGNIVARFIFKPFRNRKAFISIFPVIRRLREAKQGLSKRLSGQT
ncbi:TPA: hypothetical protein HA241_04385 [Candidatus Woesearchaeota archaeon]|nr:hypothetical protein [Candidatus Woesearchaeota archaeon]